MRLLGPAYLAAGPFLMGGPRKVFLFDTKKEPKKCPLLPIAREARPRGPAPWEPQRGGREVKKLKNAGVLRFSSRYFTSLHIDPSGAKINSMGVELKAPLCKG